MRIGLYTDGLAHLDRRAALRFCAERGIGDVELGVGTWSPRPHLDLVAALREPAERDRLSGELREHGLRLAAINAAGNPLHPEPGERRRAEGALRGAIELAGLLGVERVVTMSGCPGGRQGGPVGVFAVWSLSCDDEPLLGWQLQEVVYPYWRELSRFAAQAAPAVRICLELHPGVAVFGVDGFARLRRETGPNVAVNLDPSHFFWQGIDPVAVIDELGEAVAFAHGKDATLYPERIRLHGLLDPRYPVDPATAAWHYSAVGQGHDDATWAAIVAALRGAGYDGVVSIEHEDPTLAPEDSIETSLRALQRVLSPEVVGA